jgi:hypothetical protein
MLLIFKDLKNYLRSFSIPPLVKGGEGGFYENEWKGKIIYKISPSPSLPKRG